MRQLLATSPRHGSELLPRALRVSAPLPSRVVLGNLNPSTRPALSTHSLSSLPRSLPAPWPSLARRRCCWRCLPLLLPSSFPECPLAVVASLRKPLPPVPPAHAASKPQATTGQAAVVRRRAGSQDSRTRQRSSLRHHRALPCHAAPPPSRGLSWPG